MFEERTTRRDALKKAVYITPVILTFLAAPSFASGGSGTDERNEGSYESETSEGGKYEINEGGGGHGKRGRRWLWDYEREERQRKKHWWE